MRGARESAPHPSTSRSPCPPHGLGDDVIDIHLPHPRRRRRARRIAWAYVDLEAEVVEGAQHEQHVSRARAGLDVVDPLAADAHARGKRRLREPQLFALIANEIAEILER